MREPNYRFCPQCGFPIEKVDELPADPLVGRILGDAYVLLEKIGSDGMGAVYRAEQRTLGRTVAVKVIHGHLLHDTSLSERFFNEAHAASRLSHPHVVSVIDFGKTEAGLPYLVMEYLRGHDLRTVMREAGLMDIQRIQAIVLQVLEALGEAHALGIIHRDLKPANMVLEPTRLGGDFVKVVDFGLAKILHGSSERALATGGLVRGTPTYMAPEQAQGGTLDARTDIYALGVTLFELLVGKPPFEAESMMDVMLKHVHAPPPDPRTFAPDRGIPASLARMVLRALAKDPDERFGSADEFARELRASDSDDPEESAYPTIPVPGRAAACPTCGEPLTSSQKFCGACGMRVGSASPPSGTSNPLSVPSSCVRMGRRSTHFSMRVEGAEQHQAWMQDLRLHHDGGALAFRLVGPHGAGKTTLLRDFAAAARAHGDAVAMLVPDRWWARPAYHGLRSTILQLVRLPDDGRDPLGWAGASGEAVPGLEDIFLNVFAKREGDPPSHRLAVAKALVWALQRAHQGSLTGRVVVVIDDLDRIDGPSQNAFADALSIAGDLPWMLVAGHVPHFEAGWPSDALERLIQGIPLESGRQMLRAVGASEAGLVDFGWVSPLLVEQSIRAKIEGHDGIAGGLADVVACRMAALSSNARAVLDAMAVLGDDVDFEQLSELLEPGHDIDEGLLALAVGGFIHRGENGFLWVNPLYREVAQGATPAAVRTRLYSRAVDVFDVQGVPIEVRARVALEAGHGIEALFLLECIAQSAQVRGDTHGAREALRRGYELARSSVGREALEEPNRAVVVFGRKLAEALLREGRLGEAQRTVHQVLELADESSAVDVLSGMANVARAENRSGEAQSFLCEAITRARRSGKVELIDSLEELERKWAS